MFFSGFLTQLNDEIFHGDLSTVSDGLAKKTIGSFTTFNPFSSKSVAFDFL